MIFNGFTDGAKCGSASSQTDGF